MMRFSQNEITVLLLGIALMLAAAKIMGELFRRMRLPSMAGEIIAGLILGPTLLGRIAPHFSEWIFPAGARIGAAHEGLVQLAIVFLLLIAGMEVDLSSVWKQGRAVARVSVFTVLVPFALGASLAWFFPGLLGAGRSGTLTFFMGIAMAITALPIVAKMLMDLNLIQTDFGMLVLASALMNDLAGWMVFSAVIHMMDSGAADLSSVFLASGLTLAVSVVIITVARFLIDRALPWIQAKTEWPGGVISFTVVTALLFSALTEAIGAHAIFGAFLAGIAIGDSAHLKRRTRDTIAQFVNNIFTPLFFVSIGMMVDLARDLDIVLAAVLIALSFAGKIAGSWIAGTLSGLARRESLAVGSAMSATGTMQIILGLIARSYGVIGDGLFAALIFTALVTSVASAPMVRAFLGSRRTMRLTDFIDGKLFVPSLASSTAEGAIGELAEAAAKRAGLRADDVARAVLEREALMSTGIGLGVAVPHARLRGLKGPVVALGASRDGIDFNASDGAPARLVFLILTPWDDQEAQIGILAEISNIFLDAGVRERCSRAAGYNELVTALKMAYHAREQKD